MLEKSLSVNDGFDEILNDFIDINEIITLGVPYRYFSIIKDVLSWLRSDESDAHWRSIHLRRLTRETVAEKTALKEEYDCLLPVALYDNEPIKLEFIEKILAKFPFIFNNSQLGDFLASIGCKNVNGDRLPSGYVYKWNGVSAIDWKQRKIAYRELRCGSHGVAHTQLKGLANREMMLALKLIIKDGEINMKDI